MPNNTAELGLKIALDNDDAADYETIYLANSLTTLDGLFSQTTGHTHAGAHQGGPINGNAFSGAMDIPDWFRSTGHRSAYATAGAGMEMFYDGTNGILQGYDRAGSQYRPLYIKGTSIVFQPNNQGVLELTSGGLHLLHNDSSGAAWIRARSGTTGIEFVNNAYSAVTFTVDDSGNVTIPGTLSVVSETISGTLNVTGLLTSNAHNVNGVLTASSLHVTGNTTHDGTSTLTGAVNAGGNVTVQNNVSNVVPFTVGGVYEHIEHGQLTLNGITNNTAQNQSITFARAFNSNPIVIISVGAVSVGDVQQWHAAAQNISTTNFNARLFNTSGSTGNGQIYWLAMGN